MVDPKFHVRGLALCLCGVLAVMNLVSFSDIRRDLVRCAVVTRVLSRSIQLFNNIKR